MIAPRHATSSTQGGNAAARDMADWLCLAATPVFALMALLTGVLDRGAQDTLCQAMPSPLAGMATMYLLMGAFHLPPWLRLVSRRRRSRAMPPNRGHGVVGVSACCWRSPVRGLPWLRQKQTAPRSRPKNQP